jgi:hypothetical protein
MHFPTIISLVLALFAVRGVFIEIPFVSTYAFWIVIAAYVIQASSITRRNILFSFALVLALLAVVGVFVEIPFVSTYAFWIAIAAYLINVSSTAIIHPAPG